MSALTSVHIKETLYVLHTELMQHVIAAVWHIQHVCSDSPIEFPPPFSVLMQLALGMGLICVLQHGALKGRAVKKPSAENVFPVGSTAALQVSGDDVIPTR